MFKNIMTACLVVLAVCAFNSEIFGRETQKMNTLVLAQDGKANATIVIATNATRAAQFAAFELRYHLNRITGGDFTIITNGLPTKGISIMVGDSGATRALGIAPETFGLQEYLIRFLPDAIILMGRDKEDRGKLDYANPASFPGYFDDQATCYAVYDFLERFCGIRWYLPTELGLVCPAKPTLSVAGNEIRRAPVVKYRFDTLCSIPGDLCGDTVKPDQPTPGLSQREQMLWEYRNRRGGEAFAVNHSFYGYYDRFLKKNPKNEAVFEGEHPDWFAQDYEKSQPNPPQLCYTNPDMIRQIIQDARDYFDGKGKKYGAHAEGDYFAVMPMDNGSWCKCANCQALLKKEATRGKGRFTNDRASDYVFGFANKVAREIAKSHPNKQLSISAYSEYAYPPEREPLEPNVSVSICFSARQTFAKTIQENDRVLFSSWVNESKTRRKFTWSWYCFPSLGALQQQTRCFPGFFAHPLAKQLQLNIPQGIRGIFYEPSYLEESRKSVLMDQLESYVTWKLADNPVLDGNALIDEFFLLYYGSAAKPMQAFYEQVEEIYGNPKNYPPQAEHQSAEIAWVRLGTAARMAELGKLMAQAHAAARTDLEKQRVALFDKGIWQYMRKGRETYLECARIPIQSASVPRIPEPTTTNLASLDWSQAGVLTNWLGTNGKERADKHDKQMEGRLLHDGKHLYIRLQDMMDPKQLVDRSSMWNDDEYELFFGRQREPECNQIGVTFTGRHEAYQWPGAKPWNSGVKIVSDCTPKDRWLLYLVFPLDRLIPGGAKAGDKFYMNILRSMGFKEGAVAWNATLRGYNAPERFGEITLK